MNFTPLIEGIAKLIGHTDPVAVERYIGPLSQPAKQLPVIHDYLRGQSALSEMDATGANDVRGISRGVWNNTQARLQALIDSDPEAATALKSLYAGVTAPAEKGVTTTSKMLPPDTPPIQGSYSVPETTPDAAPPARVVVPRSLPKQELQARSDAFRDFSLGVESQDPTRIDAAMERIRALHENDTPPIGERLPYERTLDYMSTLEQSLDGMRQQGLRGDQWDTAIDNLRASTDLNPTAMPKYLQDAVFRFDAWAKAQKPPSLNTAFSEALGVPRAVMSSTDLSAPGRQGILMMSRPEYWQHMKTMIDAWSEPKYLESQAYLRAHPDFKTALDSGLALTDINHKLGPQEEAFQSKLAEKIPFFGKVVKSSEQAYTTFLNRVRFDIFSNDLKLARASGQTIDQKFLDDLAEWVNTYTGRGGGKNTNFGALSTVMFSPRLAAARAQTLNPAYYFQMHPFVRQQALKTGFASAASIMSLVSLAGLAGAKVTWDFRNPDAGKIRVGNTRLDLGGGLFQFVRLLTQIATNEQVNSTTGKVTKLGEKYGTPTRLDKLTQFLISKEAPVASFVTDWMRGKDLSGQKFSIPKELATRMIPLAMQDVYDVIKSGDIQNLLWAIPAGVFGLGLQTYGPSLHPETVPFAGVQGQVPDAQAQSYAQAIEEADKNAAAKAFEKTKGMNPRAAETVLRSFVKMERFKARQEWIQANRGAYRQAIRTGQTKIPLTAPEGQK